MADAAGKTVTAIYNVAVMDVNGKPVPAGEPATVAAERHERHKALNRLVPEKDKAPSSKTSQPPREAAAVTKKEP